MAYNVCTAALEGLTRAAERSSQARSGGAGDDKLAAAGLQLAYQVSGPSWGQGEGKGEGAAIGWQGAGEAGCRRANERFVEECKGPEPLRAPASDN